MFSPMAGGRRPVKCPDCYSNTFLSAVFKHAENVYVHNILGKFDSQTNNVTLDFCKYVKLTVSGLVLNDFHSFLI